MTTLDLDALERAARAAAGGDWRFAADQISSGAKTIATVEWGRGYRPTMAEKNGRFIEAAQPSTILSLISDHRALQERVEGAEKTLRPFAHVAEQDIGEDEADDDMFRPMLAFNRAPQPKVGDFRAVLAYFAARTKAGEPHAEQGGE